MNTKSKGEIAEAFVLAKMLELGYAVLIPWGDNQRYDLVIDDNGEFKRVQCKWGRYRNGAVVFNAHSQNVLTQEKSGYRGDADFFGVYCRELGKVYLVPVDDCSVSETCLRVEPPRNNQEGGIRWASDYEL